MNSQLSNTGKKPLRIMKFGGTSVGDGASIQKVVDIIRGASHDCDLVVVVSAMSGVTNQLIEAATQAQAGNRESVEVIFAAIAQTARRGSQRADPFGSTAEPHQPGSRTGFSRGRTAVPGHNPLA